ncbi:MAG: GntR family transcriptional regulator [Prevotella sp.]|jgi:GntR family transcriptional regulator
MKLGIDHDSETPLHQQAEALLRKLIETDDYQRGKLLPSEVELSKKLKISRNTLRQAINKLVFEGLLVRKRGVGTAVAQKRFVSRVQNWLSFSQEMKRMGIVVRNYELYVSFKSPQDNEIRNFFGMKEEDDSSQCMVLKRLRGNPNYPFVYFTSWFNPSIPFTGDENFTMPLYEILEKEYHVVVKVNKESVRADLAGNFIAEKLGISAKDPILIRKRFVYDQKGVPVEYNIGYYRADSFVYTIEAIR